MSEERDDLIVLVDENGDEVEFEHVDTIDMDGNEYVVLMPYREDEPEEDEEEEVVILKIEHNDNGDDAFVTIEDEDELDSVFEEFQRRIEEDYEDEDDEE